jgi:protein-tyrosine phosphatase
MAEFILKKMISEQGLDGKYFISSCATSTEEIWGGVGNPVYPPAKAELKKHGIDCGGKRAVQLKKSDYDKYDLFICMDGRNIANAIKILESDPEMKLKKLMDFTPRGGDVADPWYTDQFDVTYRDIFDGCKALLAMLESK